MVLRRAALTLPELSPPSPPLSWVPARTVYGLSAVDYPGPAGGPGDMAGAGLDTRNAVQIRTAGGLVVVDADPHVAFAVTQLGHVRIPATIRHWCGLVGGIACWPGSGSSPPTCSAKPRPGGGGCRRSPPRARRSRRSRCGDTTGL